MDQNKPKDDQDGATKASKEHKIARPTVVRIMRHGMPEKSRIATDAKESMTQCVAEFSALLTRAAAEECRRDRRTTVNGDDLILALRNLGFDDYVESLTSYLRLYREIEGKKPRARHSKMVSPEAPPPVAPAAEAEAQPPSPDLTLQLGPPSVRDITDLGVNDDVYAVLRGAAPAAGTSAAPAIADDDE
ncbi:unnamed protein product [Urochloa humidicola]